MNVLILDNYDSFTHNIFHYCKSYTDAVTVCRNDDISLDEIESFSHIILSPGPGLPKNAGLLMETIRTFEKQKKILGICLGLQAIVEHFGGELYNQPLVKHGLPEEISLLKTESGLFNNFPNKCVVGLYHSWAVDHKNFPGVLEISALSKSNVIMGIQHRTLPIYGVQFHPESIMTEKGKEMIGNWLNNA